MTLESNSGLNQSTKSEELALHFKNPWTQQLYRWYQVNLKFSPSLIALDEEEIEGARQTLDYLRSDYAKACLKSYPENKESISLRKKEAISSINHKLAGIASHQASLRSVRDQLIRYGFLDTMGNSLYDPS